MVLNVLKDGAEDTGYAHLCANVAYDFHDVPPLVLQAVLLHACIVHSFVSCRSGAVSLLHAHVACASSICNPPHPHPWP